MPGLPADVKLLVAGSGDSASQRPPSFYQDLAEELGVADRCFWDVRYIPDVETGDLFAAADLLLMTYSAKFRSASGVMNTAVSSMKAILGSSGPGPFRSAILDYELGIYVRPDDDAAIHAGAREVLDFGSAAARWSDYEQDHSWQENAQRVTKALAEK
jgi:glycosyltransferase involved in cell wall biosynthesis